MTRRGVLKILGAAAAVVGVAAVVVILLYFLPDKGSTDRSAEAATAAAAASQTVDMEHLVVDSYYEAMDFTDGKETIRYSYRIPKVDLTGTAVTRINNAIDDDLKHFMVNAESYMEDQESSGGLPACTSISYFWNLRDQDILSLVTQRVMQEDGGRKDDYTVYNLRVSDRTALTREDLLKYLEISEEEFTANIKKAMISAYLDRYYQYIGEVVSEEDAVNAMARTSLQNIRDAMGLLKTFSEEGMRRVEQTEDLVDRYEDKLGTYLVKLNTNELDRRQNESVSKFLTTLSDFERISDHAMNVADVARELKEKQIVFSGSASHELDVLTAAINEILDLAFSAFMEEDKKKARLVEPLEEHIDHLCDTMKLRHVDRLQKGQCSLSQGFVFNDLLSNFERVADHCSNLAIAMIELESDAFDTHDYLINLKELHSQQFEQLVESYAEKYKI